MTSASPGPITVVTDHGHFDKFVGVRRRVDAPNLPLRLGALVRAWRLWRVARTSPGHVVIVTYGSLSGFLLCWIQALARPFVKPRVHVMFDLLLERRRSGLPGLWDRWKAAGFRSSRACAVVWGMDDGDVFAAEYELPIERFQFHPYHFTLDGFDYDVADEGYVFAGGNFGRDYQTLIRALDGIAWPVRVATTNPSVPPLAAGSSNVIVEGVTPDEFRRRLARCRILVEAHPHDFIRTAGHQTMLNAMRMGKPIVLADARSAPGYFDDGVEGHVVAAGDEKGLRAAVERIMGDEDLHARMSEAARRRVDSPLYGTLEHMQSIYNVALQIHHRRERSSDDAPYVEQYGPFTQGVVARPDLGTR